MALEDLNPYGQAGLKSFQSRTLQSMDASPDIPRVTDNYSIYGSAQVAGPSLADVATLGQMLTEEPEIKQPSVGINRSTNQMFVNGLMFDVQDYQTADKSANEEYLNREPPGLPDGFEPLSPEAYGAYIGSIRNPGKMRLMGKNFGIGVDNLQMLAGAGISYLGDTFDSETLSGYGRDVVEQQVEDIRRKEPFNKTFTDDVVAEGELANWFLGNLAQQGPNLIESVLAFIGGAAVSTAASGNPFVGAMGGFAGALGKTAFKKKLMDALAKKQRGEVLDKAEQRVIAGTGAVIAGALNNFRTGVSDVYLEMLENAEGEVPGSAERLAALAAGVPYAAAETFSEYFVASKFFNPAGTSNIFKRVGKAFGSGALAEGVTEGFQEGVVIGTDAAMSDREALTLQNGERLINAIAAGAAVGGPISGLSGLRSGQEADILSDAGQPGTGFTLGEGTDPQGPYRPDFTLVGDPYQGSRAGAVTPFVGQTTRMEREDPTVALPAYTGPAVITPVGTNNPVDPNQDFGEQVTLPTGVTVGMDQPVRAEGGFFPPTDDAPQGALNVTSDVTTLNEINDAFNPRSQSRAVVDPNARPPAPPTDPNQLDLPLDDEPETVTTPPRREVQLPLFTPQEAPKLPKPKRPLTDDIKQQEKEFAPSAVPQLENRRDKKDLAATVKSKGQISGGRQEDNIVDPDKRQKKFDTINYTQGIRLNLLPQFVVDRYAEAIKKIKVARRFTNFTGAHHNGGIVLAGKYTYAQPVFPNVVAHELGHASHSLLAEQINDNPAVLAELQAIENLLYPDLRATILQAITDGKKLDNEFFNYLLSPEELIAEFNVFRLANPEQAAQVAPTLSALLESVEQAPDLVIDRKTFPIGIGKIVTKATEYFDGDFTTVNAPLRRAQERAVKAQAKADKLKKGKTAEQIQIEKEGGPIAGSPEDIAQQQAYNEMVDNARNSGNVAEYKDIMQEEFQVALREIDNIAMNSYWEGLWNRANSIAAVDKVLDDMDQIRFREEMQDAVQEPETTQVDAQEQTQDGERVGEEVQETPRVRTKKESLKKGKSKKQSVQTNTKPKPKVAALKRGKQKVDPQVAEREEQKTKTPQRVEKTIAAVMTPAERWDASKPYPDYPSLEKFTDKKAVAETLEKFTTAQMEQVWEDSSLRATLPEGVQADILIAIYPDTTKADMPGVLSELIEIAFSRQSQASAAVKDRAASFLLSTTNPNFLDTIRETAIEQLRLAAIGKDLQLTGEPAWFKYASKLDILPELQQRIEASNTAGFRELMQTANLRDEQTRLDIIANEKDLNRAGTIAAARYSNPETGPVELARNIAIRLESIANMTRLTNRNHRAVQGVERMLAGLENVKPDMTYLFNGSPLSQYFDLKGKVKFKENPMGYLSITADTLAQTKKEERAERKLAREQGLDWRSYLPKDKDGNVTGQKDRVAIKKAKDKAKRAAQEKEDLEAGVITEDVLEYYKPRSILDQLSDRDGNFRRYDNDKPSNPMNPVQLRAAVKAFLAKLAVKPKVTIVKNVAELRNNNKELFDRAVKAQPEFETTNASGFSIGQDIIIFTDFIENDSHLKFILAHETMGHFGLRSIVNPSKLKQVLEDLYNTSPMIKAMADAQMEVYGIDKLEAIEEALADRVGFIETNVLKRVWENYIKPFLRKIGISFEHDSAPYWVNQLRRYVRDGEIPGVVSPDQLAANIENLNNSDVGRFSAARVNLGSGLSMGMPGFDYKDVQAYVNKGKGKAGNMSRLFGRAAETLQTLDNIALRSPGIAKLLDTFRRQSATARQILSELDRMTQRATKADFWGLGTGLNSKEKLIVGEMLAYGNAYFAQNTSEADIRGMPDAIIQDPISGRAEINQDALNYAKVNQTLTREQLKAGIQYTVGSQLQTHKLDATLGGPLSDIVNNKFTDPRHEEMYLAYVDMRDAVNYLAAKVALGKYIAAQKLADGSIESMRKIDRQINDQDLDIFKEISDAFKKIYQMGPKQNNGRYRPDAKTIEMADDFIVGITRGLWQDGAIDDFKNMPTDDFKNPQGKSQKAINAILAYNRTNAGKANPIKLDKIIPALERMRKYGIDKNVIKKQIQRPIKDQVFTDTQLINANVMAKQTMYDSYVPYKRRGKYQLRFQAYAVNPDGSQGAATTTPENFSGAFPYYQDDRDDFLRNMQTDFNAQLKDTKFDVKLDDGSIKQVYMSAITEDASGGTPTNLSYNYDEFVNVLNTFGIDLELSERERIVEALSSQHDKVRSHLKKRFQPGFDPDMIRSVAEYLETGAAIAAKNEHRTDINLIMQNEDNWKGSYDLLDSYWSDVQAAEKTGNKEAIHIAREQFEAYAHMYKESAGRGDRAFTKATDRKGNKIVIQPTGGKGNRYKDSGNQLLGFYQQQTDIAISVEDELSKGPLSSLKNLAVAMQLGGSIAAGLVNLTSLPLMTVPYMATYNSKLGTGGGYGYMQSANEIRRAMGNLKAIKWADPTWINDNIITKGDAAIKSYGLTRDEAQFLFRQTSRGVLDAALVNSLAGSSRGNFFNSANWTSITKKYMIPFAYTEQMNRRASALATYRLEKRRRMAADPTLTNADFEQESDLVDQSLQPDLFATEEKAVEVVNKSQGDYAMYNRPNIARGTWAQYIYMYKQFTVIATQLVRILPPGGRVYYLGALMAVAGLKGLPFADDLADLVDTLAQFFGLKVPPVEVAVGKFVEDVTGSTAAAQFMLRGGLDQIGGGGTYSSRLALGDLLPGTGIFLAGASTPQELKNIAGPIFSAMAGTVTTAIDLAKAPFKADTANELMRVAQASPIAGLRNIMDTAVYYNTGAVLNSRGYTVTKDIGVGTLVTRLLGFYPVAATRSNDAVRMTKRLVDYTKQISAGYRDQYVRAALMNDRSAMREIESAVRDHNRVHRRGSPFFIDDFKGKVRKAVKSAKEGAGARFLKTTPKSTRDSVTELISDIYGVELD